MPPRFRPSTDKPIESSQKICDDEEECVDGSGSGETYSQPSVSSKKEHVTQTVDHHYTTKVHRPTWTPPTPPPIVPPPLVTNYPIVTTSSYNPFYHNTNRPVTAPPARSRPIFPVSAPTQHPTLRPSGPKGPPVIYSVSRLLLN